MVENVTVCFRCLRAGHRCRCKGRTIIVHGILLKILRTLKAKGWVVERWSIDESPIEVDKKNFVESCTVQLWFFMFSPPPMNQHRRVNPEFVSSRPTIVSSGSNLSNSLTVLYDWAKAIPSFAVPFGEGLCDKCISQGADWFFSRVNCPARKAEHLQNYPVIMVSSSFNAFVNFSEELPVHCAYLVEQKLTMPDRIAEMERKGYFKRNPVARRKVAKWMKMNT